jgi:N-acetylglutamate synthase-like GNAT family acetyltransferase
MEGYKYRQNEKGIPIPIIEEGDNEGLVPRSIHYLYELIKKETSLQKKKFTVYCSYLQVYKEKIFDLLNKA